MTLCISEADLRRAELFHVRRYLIVVCIQCTRHISCSAAALISYFCISVYCIIVTLVVVAFDNLHSTEMKRNESVTYLPCVV